MTLLLSLVFILLAALVTLPWTKSAGAGRVAVFGVLSLLGVVAALSLVSAEVVPTFGDSEEATSVSESEEQTLAQMKEALESEIQLSLVSSPEVDSLRGDQPSVWRFEQDFTVLCVPQNFPESRTLDCWAPDGVIGADPLTPDAELDLDELD